MAITQKEKKKILPYVIMVFLGTMLVNSAKEIWINGWFDKFSPETIFAISVIGLLLAYYLFDLE